MTKASENSDIFNNFKWDDLQKMAQEEDDDNKPKEYKIK